MIFDGFHSIIFNLQSTLTFKAQEKKLPIFTFIVTTYVKKIQFFESQEFPIMNRFFYKKKKETLCTF